MKEFQVDSSTIEQMYALYQKDPSSLDESWQGFFKGVEFSQSQSQSKSLAVQPQSGVAINQEISANGNGTSDKVRKETNIFNLILAYRSRGHLFANISPVREREKYTPPISLERFHLNEEDLEVTFNAGAEIGLGKATLAQIIEYLETTYCDTIGSEFMYPRKTHLIFYYS